MPPKKNTMESEIKKINKKSAEDIVKIMAQNSTDVENVSTNADIAMPPLKKAKDAPMSKTRKATETEKTKADPKRSLPRSLPKDDVQKISKIQKPSTSKSGEKFEAKKNSDGKGKPAKSFRYEIDCHRVKDSVDVKDLQQYVVGQLKVNGRKDNLGNNVTVCCVGDSVVITSKVYLPKKSLRYLSKKFLKKVWNVQVVSKNKNTYELKYIGTS